METFGRERRHRYYTLAAYKTVTASENLEDTTEVDLSKVGGFAVFNEAIFYDDDETLHYYEDTLKDKEGAKLKKGAKKRKREDAEDLGDAEAGEDAPGPTPKAKRGRPRKKPRVEDNEDAPTPQKKRGRLRKQPPIDEGGDTPTTPKKHDRPHKHSIHEVGDGTATVSAVPKRRGRLSKQKLNADQAGPTEPFVAMGEIMEGVEGTLLPPSVSLSTPETRGQPLESQAMTGVTTDRQGTTSTTPRAASEFQTSSPKEAGRTLQESSASELISSAVYEVPEDDQAAVQLPPLISNLIESHRPAVDARVEQATHQRSHRKPSPTVHNDDDGSSRLTRQTHSATSGTGVEGLQGEGSTDHMGDSDVPDIPQQAVDGARVNDSRGTGSHPLAQESMMIDPALLEPSFVS